MSGRTNSFGLPTGRPPLSRKVRIGIATAAAGAVCAGAAAGIAWADPTDTPAAAPTGGACRTVGYVGDSTSVGMVDPQFIPDESQRLEPQLRSVAGVQRAIIDVASGRALVERTSTASPGLEALETINQQNPDCFVVALGTNDAAAVAGGASVNAAQRIEKVMAIAGGRPVLWPTVKTTDAARSHTGFAPEAMTAFDQALDAAKATYPNLTVFDWAAQASDSLFYPDGIHYTPAGTTERVTKFAEALRDMSVAAAASMSVQTTTMPGMSPAAESTDTTSAAPATVTETTTETTTETVTSTPAASTVTETVTATPPAATTPVVP
ncbi:SGNH/GDSL hydrolase family protein [Gordonia sp. N1V]|uniref:SGNH/GDSL hydrolase family protein n=1 Tax=Gordonia sp. N1V TaxID=3034163 RepID=UPI0023E19175|nr:SGNH/GDSL hydrolase family protein [Gordonia sp. N1V]MDF3284990.1 SGNH/GDSL hydrolase family protein [Gordonia sp. N1V]